MAQSSSCRLMLSLREGMFFDETNEPSIRAISMNCCQEGTGFPGIHGTQNDFTRGRRGVAISKIQQRTTDYDLVVGNPKYCVTEARVVLLAPIRCPM